MSRKYRNHEIVLTGNTTEITAYCYNRPYRCVVGLYRVEGVHDKAAGERPFLTSLREAREWIDEQSQDGDAWPQDFDTN